MKTLTQPDEMADYEHAPLGLVDRPPGHLLSHLRGEKMPP